MKKRNLLSMVAFCAAVLAPVSSWAQEDADVTPDRFKFGPDSELEVGPFQVDGTYADWNPPASYAPAKDGNTGGYVLLHGDPDNDKNFAVRKAALNIIDLGGDVGKVLCIAGGSNIKDLLPYAVGTSEGWVPHINLTMYAPADLSVSGNGKIRFTVTYKAYQEEPTDEAEFFKFYAKNWSNDNATLVLCYSGGARLGTEGENEWKTYESELAFNDLAAQFPMCCKFEFPKVGGNVLLIKEFKFTLNPSTEIISADKPVSSEFVMNPPTGLSKSETTNFTYSVSGNKLNIKGLEVGENVVVYTVLGSEISSAKAVSSEMNISLNKGAYIVKVGSKGFKVLN